MKSKKSQTMYQMTLIVFQLEAEVGHLKWKVTDVVRRAKISRPLVYRYFGSSKKEMLLSAIRVFTTEFYGFGDSEKKGLPLEEKIRLSRQRTIENHEAVLFYQKWRSKKSWIQDEFISIEQKFQRSLQKGFPHLTPNEIVAVHAFIHGLVTAPFLTASQSAQASRLIQKLRFE